MRSGGGDSSHPPPPINCAYGATFHSCTNSLGARRAQQVAAYLDQLGIGSDRIPQSSRCKLDAQGTDEDSWAVDRSVDILLGE